MASKVELGEYLRKYREKQGMIKSVVAKNGGIRHDQVSSVEKGELNYTIDVFLGYLKGVDIDLVLKEKSN